MSDRAEAVDGRSRIVVDGYNLALPQGTGVATYGRNLVAAIARLGAVPEGLYGLDVAADAEPLLREIALADPPGPRRRRFAWARAAGRVVSASARGVDAGEIVRSGRVVDPGTTPPFARVWNAQRLFAFAQTYFDVTGRRLRVRLPGPQPAVAHWTYPLPIALAGARNIYTLHDLVPLRLPHTTLDRKDRYLRLVSMLAKTADHLVTVSEASRRDIVELLGVAPERVTNTYQSVEVDHAGLNAAEARSLVAGALGLEPGGYHLFFGALEPKKNIDRLLQAFLAADIERPLVLVGKPAWKSEGELRLLKAAEASGSRRLLHLDYVPRPLLRSLVRGARTVLFPSLYEGFGLPVLEALALGAPVITSDTSSLPEVAGEAALKVDPYDVRALAEAIRTLDGDDALRADLAARGPAQAALFSPAVIDARLAALYRAQGAAV